MSLIGHRTLNPTTDQGELATRATCAADGHPPCTYNPNVDATWCRCGALVVAGDSAPIPTPRNTTPRGKFDTAADLQRRAERMAERRAERYGKPSVWDDLDMRARYLADQGWSAEDITAVLGESHR